VLSAAGATGLPTRDELAAEPGRKTTAVTERGRSMVRVPRVRGEDLPEVVFAVDQEVVEALAA
jgi:hypothetical protein